MFCFLEEIELKVERCPVRCIYRDKVGRCAYQELTPDLDGDNNELPVTATRVSSIKKIKLYKIKAEASTARRAIKLGLLILGYADHIKKMKPTSAAEEIRHRSIDQDQTGDEGQEEYEKVEDILLCTFGLGFEQRQMFHDPKVFKGWAAQIESPVRLSDLIEALVNLPSPSPPKFDNSRQLQTDNRQINPTPKGQESENQ